MAATPYQVAPIQYLYAVCSSYGDYADYAPTQWAISSLRELTLNFR
jgi:hypothetical protein